MDTMLLKLEKYADNLESIVQQRTAELMDEKHKTDTLLNRMLPPYGCLASRTHTYSCITVMHSVYHQKKTITQLFAVRTNLKKELIYALK